MRKRPQALQRTEPASSRRQRGVVDVVQFWQIGGAEEEGAEALGEEVVVVVVGKVIVRVEGGAP